MFLGNPRFTEKQWINLELFLGSHFKVFFQSEFYFDWINFKVDLNLERI